MKYVTCMGDALSRQSYCDVTDVACVPDVRCLHEVLGLALGIQANVRVKKESRSSRCCERVTHIHTGSCKWLGTLTCSQCCSSCVVRGCVCVLSRLDTTAL